MEVNNYMESFVWKTLVMFLVFNVLAPEFYI
jgi:hypothetical protein